MTGTTGEGSQHTQHRGSFEVVELILDPWKQPLTHLNAHWAVGSQLFSEGEDRRRPCHTYHPLGHRTDIQHLLSWVPICL